MWGLLLVLCVGITSDSIQGTVYRPGIESSLVLYKTNALLAVLSLWQAERNLTTIQRKRYPEDIIDMKMLSLESGVIWPQAKDSITNWKNFPLELWRDCGSDDILVLTQYCSFKTYDLHNYG